MLPGLNAALLSVGQASPVEIEYAGGVNSGSLVSNTITYSGVPIGTAEAGRRIILAIGTSQPSDLVSVTINGVGCPLALNEKHSSFDTGVAIAISEDEIASGTTATVVLTYSSTSLVGNLTRIAVFAATNIADITPTYTAIEQVAGGNGSPQAKSFSIPVRSGGVIIGVGAAAFYNSGAGGGGSWSGLTQDDFFNGPTVAAGLYAHAAHRLDNGTTPVGATATLNDSYSPIWGVAAFR